jgi:OOP family OmpA-OmpF porin
MKITKLITPMSLLLLVACASAPKVQTFSETADSNAEITLLENNLGTAKQSQVDVLAKKDYLKANKQLTSARKEDDREDILEKVAEGNAWLAQANLKAEKASASLTEILAVRERALEKGATEHAKKDLYKADEDLSEMANDLQDSKYQVDMKDQRELLNAYLAVELLTLKNANLGTAKGNLRQAEKEDAEEYAPRTLALVKTNINELETYIMANKDNSKEIAQFKSELDKRSEYLLKITREAKKNNTKSGEQLAIEDSIQEQEKRRIAQDLVATQSNLTDTSAALSTAITDNDELTTNAELRKKYEETKAKFSNTEAEVYLSGSNILIRLKGLQFSSGKSELVDRSEALLSKVDSAIQTIGDSKVRVEGHTDSVGSKAINQKLSDDRATVVENYLVKQGSVSADKIDAAGYGDAKPLATNKTKDGRAQNRRVDIVISPL